MVFSSGRPCWRAVTIWLSDMLVLSTKAPAWNFGPASFSRVYKSKAIVLRMSRRL